MGEEAIRRDPEVLDRLHLLYGHLLLPPCSHCRRSLLLLLVLLRGRRGGYQSGGGGGLLLRGEESFGGGDGRGPPSRRRQRSDYRAVRSLTALAGCRRHTAAPVLELLLLLLLLLRLADIAVVASGRGHGSRIRRQGLLEALGILAALTLGLGAHGR